MAVFKSMDGSPKAFRILRFCYVVLSLIAGLDKFSNSLVNWTAYLSPIVSSKMNPCAFMKFVGVVEIASGLLAIVNPRSAGYVIAA